MIVDEQRTKVQREPRRELRKRPTWLTVDDGVTKIECFVLDVSPGGAKIATDIALDVRDSFELANSCPERDPFAASRKRCGHCRGLMVLLAMRRNVLRRLRVPSR